LGDIVADAKLFVRLQRISTGLSERHGLQLCPAIFLRSRVPAVLQPDVSSAGNGWRIGAVGGVDGVDGTPAFRVLPDRG
jgi:hypothetical protein